MTSSLPHMAIAACILFTLASCSDTAGGPNQDGVLLPLSVGNRWNYVSWYGSPSLSDSHSFYIDRTYRFQDGSQSYRRITLHHSQSSIPSYGWLFRNTSVGLQLVGGLADSDTIIAPGLIRQYPQNPGSTIQAPRLAYDIQVGQFSTMEPITVTLVSAEVSLSTPAGQFKCVGYRYSYRPSDDVLAWWNVYEYYALGVGLVAEVVKNQIPGQPEIPDTVQLTLLRDYHLN